MTNLTQALKEYEVKSTTRAILTRNAFMYGTTLIPTDEPSYIVYYNGTPIIGKDITAGKCPTCHKFQQLVSPDYLCKRCAQTAIDNINLGITS